MAIFLSRAIASSDTHSRTSFSVWLLLGLLSLATLAPASASVLLVWGRTQTIHCLVAITPLSLVRCLWRYNPDFLLLCLLCLEVTYCQVVGIWVYWLLWGILVVFLLTHQKVWTLIQMHRQSIAEMRLVLLHHLGIAWNDKSWFMIKLVHETANLGLDLSHLSNPVILVCLQLCEWLAHGSLWVWVKSVWVEVRLCRLCRRVAIGGAKVGSSEVGSAKVLKDMPGHMCLYLDSGVLCRWGAWVGGGMHWAPWGGYLLHEAIVSETVGWLRGCASLLRDECLVVAEHL